MSLTEARMPSLRDKLRAQEEAEKLAQAAPAQTETPTEEVEVEGKVEKITKKKKK